MLEFIGASVTAVLSVILCLLMIVYRRQTDDNLPPGPYPWPIVGNLPLLTGDVVQTLADLRKEHGDVFTLYLGSVCTVFVNGLQDIRKVLVTRGEHFADRPKLFITEVPTNGKGIISTSGDTWREQRRFVLQTLRDYGFGKASLEDKILEEATVLTNYLQLQNGQSFSLRKVVHTSTANVVCSVIFGSRFEHDDPKLTDCLYKIEANLAIAGLSPLNFIPILRNLPIPGDVFKAKQYMINSNAIDAFVQEQIDEHKRTINPHHPRDFMDCYLAEIEKQSDPSSSFEEEQLSKVVSDLIIAGSDTTANTILWALLYFVNNPKIQHRIRDEIHTVVGRSRLPCLVDRKHLPYMEATLMEIQRCADVAFLGVPHTPARDTTLHGYTIPKGATVITVLPSIHKDPSIWNDPDKFDPGRFLDSQGKVNKSDHFLPFSSGKRVCLGESLAKMELFLFLTAVLQRFVLKPPEGVTSLPCEPNYGITRSPKPYQLRAVLDY